jgi:hypothetical protein
MTVPRIPSPDATTNGRSTSGCPRLGWTLARGARLIRLPTACSLGEWFRLGGRVWAEGVEPFQIVYLHDYNLKKARPRWLLGAFLTIEPRTAGSHRRVVQSSGMGLNGVRA